MSQMMPSQGPPPGLAALLGGSGPPGGGDAPDDDGLQTLQSVIHGVVALLHDLTDPQDKAIASKALQLLMPLQAKMMAGAPGGSAAQGR